jgi:hypothetical protein
MTAAGEGPSRSVRGRDRSAPTCGRTVSPVAADDALPQVEASVTLDT